MNNKLLIYLYLPMRKISTTIFYGIFLGYNFLTTGEIIFMFHLYFVFYTVLNYDRGQSGFFLKQNSIISKNIREKILWVGYDNNRETIVLKYKNKKFYVFPKK